MRLAKASKEDIKELMDFFHVWETLESDNWDIDEDDWAEDQWEMLKMWKLPPSEHEWRDDYQERKDALKVSFMKHWYSRVNWRYTRVVLGADMLIDHCCDPEKDYLDYHPKFKEVLTTN